MQYMTTGTGTDGTYSFSSLAAGAYTVEFGLNGYLTQTWGGDNSALSSSPIIVTAGQVTTKDITLVKAASISGKVTGSGTGGLSNVYVYAYDSTYNYVGGGDTDESGNYTIDGLSTGSYRLYFSGQANYLSQWWSGKSSFSEADYVAISAGQDLTGKNAVLAVGATVSGKVTGTAGAALSGVTVQASPNGTGSYPDFVTTDASGAYTITGLAAGSYRLEFTPQGNYLPAYYGNVADYESATLITVTTGQVVTGKNASLAAGAVISGNVKAGVTNLAGAKVELFSASWDYSAQRTTTTDAAGNFSFIGLVGASYKLRFSTSDNYAPEWFNHKSSFADATALAVSAGQTLSGQNVVLSVGAQISGNVKGQGSSTVNLGGATVQAIPTSGSGAGATLTATTDSAGNYNLVGLPAGTYALQFSTAANYLSEWFDDKSSLTTAAPITVAAGAVVTGKNAVLTAGATVSGTVTGVGGVPVAGAEVDIVTATGLQTTYADTDSSGNFSMNRLPAGSYSLHVDAPSNSGYLSQWYSGKIARVQSDPITLTAGQAVGGKNFVLSRTASISGTVKGAGSTPSILSGVMVSLVNPSAGYIVTSVYTDSSGNYAFNSVSAGTYTLDFQPQVNRAFTEQWWGAKSDLATATTFDVTTGQVITARNATLALGGAISGTVSSSTAPALPIAGVSVAAYTVADVWAGSATTAADGTYTVSGLQAGSYKLQFTPAYHTNYLPQFFGATTFDAATAVSVTGNVTATGKNVSLRAGATVSGVVTVAGAAPTATWSLVEAYDPNGIYEASTQTDATGSYSLVGLTPGFVKLEFSAGGFVTKYSTNRASLGTADKIAVSSGKTVTGANANLLPAGSISGIVTNSDGTVGNASYPYGYATASVYTTAGGYVASAQVDSATGAFTVSGLLDGSYRLQVSTSEGSDAGQWYGNKPTLQASTAIVVAAGQAITGKNVTLIKGSTLKGNIKAGSPSANLADAWVYAFGSNGYSFERADSDASGNFTITGLPADTYTLEYVADGYVVSWWNGKTSQATATPVTVGASQNLTGFNAVLSPLLKSSISGVETDATFGTGIGGGNQVQAYTTAGVIVASTTTESDGGYVLSSLPAGTYKLSFGQDTRYAVEWFGGKPTLAAADTITVAANQSVTGMNIARHRGASLAGTVVDSSSPARPMQYEFVVANNRDGSIAGYDYTDQHGNYLVTGLAAGSYKLSYYSSTRYQGLSSLAPQWWPGKTSLATATAITLTAGQAVTGKNATLSSGASISGTVSNVQGEKLDGITVPIWQQTGSTYTQVGATRTDGSGNYSMPGLAPGTYKVGFTDYSTGNSYDGTGGFKYTDQFSSAKATLTAADPITVTAAQAVAAKNAVLVPKPTQLSLTAAPPTISGTAALGQTLTAVTNGWSPTGIAFTYQWKRANLPIGTGATYKVVAGDVGSAITVTVTGTKAGYYTVSRDSGATASVAANVLTATPVPTVSGTAAIGQKLTAAAGTWAPAVVTLVYQWSAGGVAITGATASTYTVTAAEAGKALTVTVTGSKPGYATVATTSVATAVVPTGTLTVGTPTISGTAKVGQQLTAATGTWAPTVVTFGYQWNRAGVAIAGATASTYTLVNADAGKTITVTVTGSKTGYTTVAKTSPGTAVVTGGTLTAPTPTISGTAKVGQTLTAKPGTWAPATVTLRYQWKRGGVAIVNATAATYKPVAADKGLALTVTVTGSQTGFDSKSVTSAATAKVVP